jgi:chromosome partitioning protein
MAVDEQFLSTDEVSRLLNVHQNTVMRWIKTGKLPSTKIGRDYRIPRDAIENLSRIAPIGTRIIAIANQKGGVAKTTSTVNIAAGLAQRGARTLIIDLDPQGGSAISLGIPTDSLTKTVYNVLIDDDTTFLAIIKRTPFGFDIAPSNIDLAGAEIELKQKLAAEQVLKRKIEEIEANYDYILLDCPPSLGMLTINALTAARELLIPMSMEFLAIRGLDMLSKTVAKIRSVTNPDLTYLGILPTKYDTRTLNSKEIFDTLQTIAQNSGIRMFNTYVTTSVRFTESPSIKIPLILHDPGHQGAKAYMSIVEEIING